uniref:NADH-ubiquinone oxidoreductase chain 4L n=1 Tax=Limnoria quadripunctata TaxID=161573 RepID=A0A023IX85_LIMQU|nr:NADH dehydrogenase subunit 4L [Limnoria quadripunctata]
MISIFSLTIWFIFILMITGLMKLTLNWNQLISMLLGLEFLVLSVYLFMGSVFLFSSEGSLNSLYFLVFAVCESALGLSLLTLLSRGQGGEMTFNNAMLKW